MSNTFSRVGRRRRGYSPKEVDEFLAQAKREYDAQADASSYARNGARTEEISATSFSMVRNGYSPAAVDSALARLHDAYVQRERSRMLSSDGEKAWLNVTYRKAQSLYPRLKREPRSRFADAHKRGYEKDSVDVFMERIAAFFDGGEVLTAAQVRAVNFPTAKKSDAYEPAVVDVFLDRFVNVLVAVE